MHAVYCFLVKGADAEAIFEASPFYAYLDENNWYQMLCAVNRAGDVQQLCPAEDFRERDFLGRRFADLPQEQRWQEALRFAEECALWDVNAALSAFQTEPEAPEIAQLGQAAAALRQRIEQHAQTVHSWVLSNAAQLLSQLEDLSGPFTRELTDAYSTLRAMVLSGEVGLEDADAVILFVDIHT